MKQSYLKFSKRLMAGLIYILIPTLACQVYGKTSDYDKKYLIAIKTKQKFESLTRIEVFKHSPNNFVVRINGKQIPNNKTKEALNQLDSLAKLIKNKNNFNCLAGRFSLSIYDNKKKSQTLFTCIESNEYGLALKHEKELKDLAGIL